MGKIVGIDLGTTKSTIAAMLHGRPVVIPISGGGRHCPSVVGVCASTGERTVGQPASRQAITNPENTVRSIKRLMGREFYDPAVQGVIARLPYRVTLGSGGLIRVWMGGQPYWPPEIAAMILHSLKADAEAYLREPVTQAVITAPAVSSSFEREAVKLAGRIAGLEVLRIIGSTTAASLAYGLRKRKDEQIAVYDLGGGTFDVSILSLGDGVFEVNSTDGDAFLGGDDFDQRVMDWIADEYRREQRVDLRQDRIALQRLRGAAERAKIELSTVAQTEISLPFITADGCGPKHLQMTLTRSKLEQLVGDLVEKSMARVRQALGDAKLEPGQVDEVVLVGGQTRMPMVQETVHRYFGREPHKGANPDEVVALGAAIVAGVLGGEVKDVLFLDVAPLMLGIGTLGGVAAPLIERNTTIPTRRTQVFTTAKDGQTSVEIHVLEGKGPMAADSKTLGRLTLDGIPPAPKGIPQIVVTFFVDADGILHVSAQDRATGREIKATISGRAS